MGKNCDLEILTDLYVFSTPEQEKFFWNAIGLSVGPQVCMYICTMCPSPAPEHLENFIHIWYLRLYLL
jgi:hypothetical protein